MNVPKCLKMSVEKMILPGRAAEPGGHNETPRTAKPPAPWTNKSLRQTAQLASGPKVFDRTAMTELCVGVLVPLFTTPPAGGPAKEQA